MYRSVEDLVETITTPANCRSSRVTLAAKDNFDFSLLVPVHVNTDIHRPNLFGCFYLRLLTSLHFPSATGFHTFNYPMYRPVEQYFIESIAIRLVTKTGENVVSEGSDIPCLVILHFKKKSSTQ